MSGGSYDYIYSRIEDMAGSIRRIGGCDESAAPPEIRKAFQAHLFKVAAACKAIEWNDSGDGNDNEIDLILACISPRDVHDSAMKEAETACLALESVIEILKRMREIQ